MQLLNLALQFIILKKLKCSALQTNEKTLSRKRIHEVCENNPPIICNSFKSSKIESNEEITNVIPLINQCNQKSMLVTEECENIKKNISGEVKIFPLSIYEYKIEEIKQKSNENLDAYIFINCKHLKKDDKLEKICILVEHNITYMSKYIQSIHVFDSNVTRCLSHSLWLVRVILDIKNKFKQNQNYVFQNFTKDHIKGEYYYFLFKSFIRLKEKLISTDFLKKRKIIQNSLKKKFANKSALYFEVNKINLLHQHMLYSFWSLLVGLNAESEYDAFIFCQICMQFQDYEISTLICVNIYTIIYLITYFEFLSIKKS